MTLVRVARVLYYSQVIDCQLGLFLLLLLNVLCCDPGLLVGLACEECLALSDLVLVAKRLACELLSVSCDLLLE